MMFKRRPGVWWCSAPAVMCKSWFQSCKRHGKPYCSGDDLLRAACSCLYLPRALGKSLPLAILRHPVAASQGGITGCPARWTHSPHLGLSLRQRAVLSASFLSITFGRLILSLINSHVVGGGKCRAAASSSSSAALACPLVPLAMCLLRSKYLVPLCPHSSGFVLLVITGSKLPLLRLLF